MPGLIRTFLISLVAAALWSFLWFEEDGVAIVVPYVGGWFFAFEPEEPQAESGPAAWLFDGQEG